MSPYHLRGWTIPLTFRAIVLRFLLANAAIIVLLYALTLATQGDDGVHWLWLSVILPLLMIMHHVLRLWPRRYWLVIFELLTSLIEVLISGFFFGILTFVGIQETTDDKEVKDLPINVMITAIASTTVISSVIALFSLLWDTVRNHGKDLIRPYDFSAGLCPPGRQWGLIFGRHNTRKQFSTDNLFIRCIRGGVAILCILGMIFLVYYDAFWNPISSSGRAATMTLKVTVSNGNFSSTLEKLVKRPKERLLNAVLMVPNVSNSDQYPTMDLNLTYSLGGLAVAPHGCKSDHNLTAVFASCPLVAIPWLEDDMVEILVTVHFSEVPSDSRVYLGMTDLTVDTLANAEPIGLGPGSNLHGTSSIVVKKRLSNMKYAIFGIPRHHRHAVVDVRGQAIDWLPSLPRNNNTATLRVTMLAQKEIEVEEEYAEASVLDGLAEIGGIWTLTKGIFATIFGSTLLFELIGIKPLSVYGLVHLFRPGRVSLAEGNSTISPEERDRIVGILKDHLLDIDEEKGDPTSLSHYNPLGIVPHVTHSSCAVGMQVREEIGWRLVAKNYPPPS